MEIIYIIVSLLLFISTILVKKSEKEQNILFWIILTSVIVLCYNVFESYIITALKLKSTLLALTIFNFIVTILILLKICKDKRVQKYYIKIKDIIALAILLVLVSFIGYTHYGFPFEIKYETTDPAVHYYFARTYYEEQSTPAGDLKTTMPGAYTNTGILFVLFSNWIDEIEFYNIYIMFDLIILYLIAAMFYIGITNKANSISKSVVALIMTIIFVCGYPLNSMIFGYSYLSVGILIMIATISIATYIKNKELGRGIFLIYMFLLTYGIFFTYYFFVPIIYASLGLYMLFDMIKNRKTKNIFSIFTIDNIINVIVILIIPTILGFCYFMLPGLISNEGVAASHIGAEGYCYRNLYSNFLFFVPFVLYYCIEKIRNKENSFINTAFIITAFFTIVLLYMGLTGKASSYYYYKTYFLISILVMQITTKAIYKLMDNKQQIYGYSFAFVYVAIIIASIIGVDGIIANNNYLINPTSHLGSYADIYNFNYAKIQANTNICTTEQIEGIKYIKSIEKNKDKIQIYGHILQMLWANDIAKITETDDMLKLQTPVELDIEGWLENENKQYYLCFDANDRIDTNSKDYNVIYENKGVIILNKK